MNEGASPSEQLLDASRRNNTDLLETIFSELKYDPIQIANLINTSRDPLGNTCIHLCCKYGSWEVLDKILDQDGGVDIDPRNTVDGDTPLHVTIKYAIEEPEHGTFIAENLIDVGANPKLRNNVGLKAIDLIHGNELNNLTDLLHGAELATDNKGVLVNDDSVESIDDASENED